MRKNYGNLKQDISRWKLSQKHMVWPNYVTHVKSLRIKHTKRLLAKKNISLGLYKHFATPKTSLSENLPF